MKLVLLSLCVVLCCSQLIVASDPLIQEVATSFVFKGFVRETPYDLSPMEKEHMTLMEQNNARAKEKMTLPTLPALVEEKVVEHKTRPLVSNVAPSMVESEGIIDGAAKIFGAGKNLVNSLTGKYKPSYSQIYEDCMACRMVWKQVEMDISNARYIEDVQASFEHNCMDAQKSVIFYKACEDMYDDMYAMTDDYMSGKYTVTQMCQRSRMCVEPTQST